MKQIPIFFSFDNNYVPQAAVTFESLLTNAMQGIHYDLFVIHTGITEENKQCLYGQVSLHSNGKLSFIDISNKFNFIFSNDAFNKNSGGAIFTIETLYRCIPMFIPEFDKYDKIIYSDVDIVVVDDISELYELDVSDSYIAGVRIPNFLLHEVTHLDTPIQQTYFGGGLWVMNLKKLRDDNIGTKIINIINHPPCRLLWNDQDIMNLACHPKISYFSYRYVSIPDWRYTLKKMNYYDKNYPNGELYEAMFRPKIIHYAGIKPWGRQRPLLSDLWYYWLKRTNFAKLFNEELTLKYKIYLFGIIPIPFTKTEIGKNKIKIKILGLISFIKIKIKSK